MLNFCLRKLIHFTEIVIISIYQINYNCSFLYQQKMGTCSCDASKAITQEGNHEIEGKETTNYQEKQIQVLNILQNSQKQKKQQQIMITNQIGMQYMHDQVQQRFWINLSSANRIEVKKALKKHFIFSQLSQDETLDFIDKMKLFTVRQDEYILKTSGKCKSYYIILNGICQIQINEQKKRLTNGDYFGNLFSAIPEYISVIALTDCLLIQIYSTIVQKIINNIKQVGKVEANKFAADFPLFKNLNQQQKKSFISCSLIESYGQGQTIYNRGDKANSFYIIKEGQVFIEQQDYILKDMDYFGQSSIMVKNRIRSNTLKAKTDCKIIQIRYQDTKSNLGDIFKNMIIRDKISKIIEQSQAYRIFNAIELKKAVALGELIQFSKGDTIFKKNLKFKDQIYVLIHAELKGQSLKYEPNSIINFDQIIKEGCFQLQEDLIATDDGIICKVNYKLETLSISSGKQIIKCMIQNTLKDKSVLKKKIQITDFHVIHQLREGNFGKVYACWNNKIQKLYAIKVLNRSYIQQSQINQYITNEEYILKTIPKFPFIVGFYKLIKDPHFIYFIMELIQGEDLFDVMEKVMTFPIDHTRFIVSQILLIIQRLHESKIVHRDLKPESLMVNLNGYLTLMDMGTAKKLKIQRKFRTSTMIGTPHYIAPQIILGKGYSFPVDLWALGIITYELLFGKLPFGKNTEDPFLIYQQIVNSSVKYPQNCSNDSKLFIDQLLNKNPQHRIKNGFNEFKKHVFFEAIDWQNIINKSVPAYYHPSEQIKISSNSIQKALAIEKNKAPGKFASDHST